MARIVSHRIRVLLCLAIFFLPVQIQGQTAVADGRTWDPGLRGHAFAANAQAPKALSSEHPWAPVLHPSFEYWLRWICILPSNIGFNGVVQRQGGRCGKPSYAHTTSTVVVRVTPPARPQTPRYRRNDESKPTQVDQPWTSLSSKPDVPECSRGHPLGSGSSTRGTHVGGGSISGQDLTSTRRKCPPTREPVSLNM